MASPAPAVVAVRELLEETVADPAGERALRSLRDDLASLVGQADTYLGDAERAREGQAIARQKLRVDARADANLREQLIRRGHATAEQLDELGMRSHEELDALEADGTLGEALEEATTVRGGARRAVELRRLPDGQFAPKGLGQILRPGDTVRVPHKSGKGTVGGRVGATGKVRLLDGPDAGADIPLGDIDVKGVMRARHPLKASVDPKSPSDDVGEFGGGDGPEGGRDKPIKVGSNVRRAASLLAEGKHVELAQTREVSTLLEHLANEVNAAKEKGKDAPNIDLCKVSVAGTNLFCVESKGIPRIQMPQLKGEPTPGSKAAARTADARGEVDLTDDFREALKAKGVKVTDEVEQADHLRASQNELNGAKIAGMTAFLDGGGKFDWQRLFVSRDNYIVDGHHRWASTVAHDAADNRLGDEKMDVARIDMDIITLLHETNKFASDWGIPQAGVT